MDFHRTPRDMARVLVQYIPCNRKVQSEVMSHFGVKLDLSAIIEIRTAEDNRGKKYQTGIDHSVVWMDERVSNNMDKANRKFVAAICMARAA